MNYHFENNNMVTNFSILNWNVNGLRARINQLVRIIKDKDPDILTLQETKCSHISGSEVIAYLKELGYTTILSPHENEGRHGVATLYKSNIEQLPIIEHLHHGRCLSTNILGIIIINNYINQGREVGHSEYIDKLNLVGRLDHKIGKLSLENNKMCILGDFNIMPDDIDVWDTNKWNELVVGCSLLEKETLKLLIERNGLVNLEPINSPRMSWYDYKHSWRKYSKDGILKENKGNYGIKCDHVLVRNVNARLEMLVNERLPFIRSDEPTSDHVPMLVQLEVNHGN